MSSWLNLNDKLINIRGQISTFANNVLAEEDKDSSESDLEELKRICASQQREIDRLQRINVELQNPQANELVPSQDSWSWNEIGENEKPQKHNAINGDRDRSDETTNLALIAGLKAQVSALEGEKLDLVKNLELLDSDFQQNVEKLALMKQNLQSDYNKLEEELIRCKDDNALLLQENTKLSAPKATTIVECQKCADLSEKLKLSESENKILVAELRKTAAVLEDYEAKRLSDAEDCKKLGLILQGYEEQVSTLKQELDDRMTTHNSIEDNDKIHREYIAILTENVKKYCSNSFDVDSSLKHPEELSQFAEFRHQVESIFNILLELRSKNESLESDLCRATQEKTEILQEKNCEIEKLIQNSEILSQEVLTKSQTLKDYELECSELIKNNDLLINELDEYKNNSGLQTISESNEDNLLMMETQLEGASKKIEELEAVISKYNNSIPEEESVSDEESSRRLEAENNELKDQIAGLHHDLEDLTSDRDNLAASLEKTRTDLENTEYQNAEVNINMDALKDEVENHKKTIQDVMEKKKFLEQINEDTRTELNTLREKLLLEKDSRLNYENQVRNLTEKLQNSKMAETGIRLQLDTMGKELTTLKDVKLSSDHSIDDMRENLKLLQAELEKSSAEKEDLLLKIQDYQNLITEKDEALAKLQTGSDISGGDLETLKQEKQQLQQTIEDLTTSRNELTNTVLTKHQESVTYHAEIQRLAQLLNMESEQKRDALDQNNALREKCESLAQSLLEEQSKVQSYAKERTDDSNREQALRKKLERLQAHLIEVEDHYTQELVKAEAKSAELQTKLNEVEHREKSSSNMYTSVSIRANQHVETLQNQLLMITNQRDELRKRVSDFEDNVSKQAAALGNLQFVLEQFQKDKDKDIENETERIRRQVLQEKKVQDELRKEISNLQSQLDENKTALLAASRLSSQLEQSKQLIVALKTEVGQLKESVSKSEDQLKSLSRQTDSKVDKNLIKNLVLGFVSTNQHNFTKDQSQILKIIATVLDFNQQDHEKIDLNRPHQGWLGSFLAPQTSQGLSQESLSQAFVKFLESESKPRVVPSLLSNPEIPSSSNSISGLSQDSSARQSPIVLSEVVLPTFADFAQNRNSGSILKDVLKDSS